MSVALPSRMAGCSHARVLYATPSQGGNLVSALPCQILLSCYTGAHGMALRPVGPLARRVAMG